MTTEPTATAPTAATAATAPTAATGAPGHVDGGTSPGPRGLDGWLHWVARRWPALLAIAIAAPGFLELDQQGGAEDQALRLGNVLIVLQLGYVVLAKLGRRWATWPVVLVGIGVVVAARALDVVAPATVLSVLALVVLTWSVIDGQLRRERELRVQAAALVAFAVLASVGLAVLSTRPTLGTVVIAIGWILHGMWDFVHLQRDMVVARSFAEWCGVIDVLLGVQLLLMLSAG